jgi:hypothetical protein
MSNSIGQPSPAFPATTAAVVSQWYEVAASFDSRPDIPRSMAVCAHDEDGNPSPFHTSSCIEIELPDGFVMPLDFVAMQNVQRIDFPVRWRINKPETVVPLQFVVFGVGLTAGGAE